MPDTNETHNPNLKSWVESANDPATDFPIQNLPLCAFVAEHDGHTHGHLGVAIGDQVLDLTMLLEAGVLTDEDEADNEEAGEELMYPYWNLAVETPEVWSTLRGKLQKFLNAETPTGGQQSRRVRQKALKPIAQTQFLPPLSTLDYTDFYASVHHAANVGSMFRPDNPLLPNYKHVPIGYHGRASSIVVSGTDIKRPSGQLPPPDDQPGAAPTFGPCKLLDYELEMGAFIARSNELGEPVSIAQAREHLLGLVLLNDWSARDIQKWEYQPLGPFLAKNFGTSISPFVVTMEALAPFRCGAEERPAGDPRPLPYLLDDEDQLRGGFDITIEAYLQSADMAKRSMPPLRLSRGSLQHMYWTFAQMVAHHTSNGCNLQVGDLIGSGTVSGPTPDSRGCLLELTWAGAGPDKKPLPRKPIDLPTGEKRTFLADGDTVIFKGYCEREGFRRIGFGECRGTIVG